MKNFVLTLSTLFLLTSCGNISKKEDGKKIESLKVENENIKDGNLSSNYKIIKETPNEQLSKNNIDIELNNKLDKIDLINIANELHSSRTNFNKLWIFYYLKDMKPASGAWATSHFDPELKVEILGATKMEEQNSKSSAENVDGKILGKWNEEQITSASYALFEKGGKLFLKTTFKNGQTMTEGLTKKKLNQYSDRLNYIENTNGEYFEINQSGELEFYNKENKKFAVGQKIE